MNYDLFSCFHSERFDSLLNAIIQKNELTIEVDVPLSSRMISGKFFLENIQHLFAIIDIIYTLK